VGDQPVRDIDELARISRELVENAADPVPVLATFERKATEFVAAVNVGLRELNDPGLEVKKAWLPVNTQVITREIAGLLGDSSLTGFRITQVFATSTAESAGLETGDLIVAVDGQRLMASAPEHYEELPTLIRNYSVGSTAELSIRRGSEELKVPVELVRAPKLDREMRKYRDENFEFTVRDVTFFDKADEQWDDTKTGVLVSEIQPGSWAELGMLRVGDLIQEVDGEAVNNVDDMQAVMEQIESAQEQFVIVQALRGIYTVYVELEPKWDQN
jgi:serine protease Do